MESHKTLNLMELPMELVVEILKRVPAKSVCHIRCVSKMLLSIVDSPSFVRLHSTFLLDSDSHLPPAPPQFILHFCLTDRYPSKPSLLLSFHSLHYDPSSAQGAQQLNPRLILQSSNPTYYSLEFVFCNLFCIEYWKDHAPSFLINPLRGEVLRLPPNHSIAQQIGGPNSKAMYISTCMGFDSITNTYKILRVTDILIPKFSVAQVLVLGTSEWRQVTSPPAKALFRFQNICAHGDTHWLLYPYTREGIQVQVHILSFDFKKEEFFWVPIPYRLPDTCCQLHLINFRGSMAIVVDTTSGTNIEIWVMKNYIKKQWMLDYSINIQVLELDLYPRFEYLKAIRYAICCEWEHGILFLLDDDESTTLTLFLDLRGPVVTKNLVKCPIEGKLFFRRIMSLNGGLISLKSYADFEEAEEPATYSDWSEGVASGKNFFYLAR
ncbi:hypothetical protein ACLB2K_009174 [Fragaria x ananassa]